MPLNLVERINDVDPVVITAKTPKITQVLAADVKSPLIPTPVLNTVYKTGAQVIRIQGTLPVEKMALANDDPDSVKLILVTVDSTGSRSETALTGLIMKATEKELLVISPNNVNESGVDGFFELRYGPSGRAVLTYDIALADAPI